MFEGHGWACTKEPKHVLYIGGLPGRKSVCLYVQDGGTIRPLAFFRSREAAMEAMAMIDRLTGAKPEKD